MTERQREALPITAPAAAVPVYVILRYPRLLRKGAVIYSEPVLVETYDYLTFYLAGCSDHEPLPVLSYQALHCFPLNTTCLAAQRGFGQWRIQKINRWVTEGAYLTN